MTQTPTEILDAILNQLDCVETVRYEEPADNGIDKFVVNINGYDFVATVHIDSISIRHTKRRVEGGNKARSIKITIDDIDEPKRLKYLNKRLKEFLMIHQREDYFGQLLKETTIEKKFEINEFTFLFTGIEFAIQHDNSPYASDWFIYSYEEQRFTKVPNFFVPKEVFTPRTTDPIMLDKRLVALNKHIDFVHGVCSYLENMIITTLTFNER